MELESTREKNGFCTRKSGLQASCTTSYFVLKANNEWHDTREPYLAVRTPDSRDEVNKGEQTWQRKLFEELYRYEVQNRSIGIDPRGHNYAIEVGGTRRALEVDVHRRQSCPCMQECSATSRLLILTCMQLLLTVN